MLELQGGSVHPEEQRECEKAYPEREHGQVEQLDDAHLAYSAGQCRGCRGISQVRFGTVLVVVPAVVQSHPASVTQAPTSAALCGTTGEQLP